MLDSTLGYLQNYIQKKKNISLQSTEEIVDIQEHLKYIGNYGYVTGRPTFDHLKLRGKGKKVKF